MRRITTPDDFRAARLELDLIESQLAEILLTTERNIRRNERAPESADRNGQRRVGTRPSSFPLHCRILEWMVNTGFRPPEFKSRSGRRGPSRTPRKVTT